MVKLIRGGAFLPLTLALSCSDLFRVPENSNDPNFYGYSGRTSLVVSKPPGVINFTALSGDGQAMLSWDNPVAYNFAGVRILRKINAYSFNDTDGFNVYENTGKYFVDTALTNGSKYYYTAFVYYTDGNISSGETANTTPLSSAINIPLSTPAGGSYNSSPQNVTLASATAGVKICYRNDGATPRCDATPNCVNSLEYTGAISVSTDQTIKAIACKVGHDPSPLWSADYSFDNTSPGAPTSFTVTAAGENQISLAWTAATDNRPQGELVYEICRSTTAGGCNAFTTTYTTTAGAILYNATGLTPLTTYFFTIRAKDRATNTGAVSSLQSATTGSGIVNDATFTPAPGAYAIAQNVALASPTPTNDALICYTTNGATPACNATPACTSGTQYSSAFSVGSTTTVKAIACKAGFTASSVTSGLFTFDTTPPGSVTAFGATAGDAQVNLAWTKPSDADLVGVRVVRKAGAYPTSYADGISVYSGSATATIDTGLTNGTQYYYAAYAYDIAGNYAAAAQVTATPLSGTVSAPTFNPTGGAFNSAQNVTLATTTLAATICYTINGVTPGCDGAANCTGSNTYIGAVNIASTANLQALACKVGAANSSVTSYTYTLDTTAPANATSFSATAGNAQVSLTWVKPVDADFAGVKILRKTGSYPSNQTDGTLIYSGTGTAATDTGLTNGTQYYYTVFAFDAIGNHASGAQATATPDSTPPGNVTGFSATPGDSLVALSWTNPGDGDFAGVKILRKTGSYPANQSDGTQVYNGTGTSTNDTGLVNGTQYYYKAFAYDTIGNHASGTQVAATPIVLSGFASGPLSQNPFGDGVPSGNIVVYDQKLYIGANASSSQIYEISSNFGASQSITLDGDGVIGSPSSFSNLTTLYTGCTTTFSNPPIVSDKCSPQTAVQSIGSIYAACIGGSSTPNLTGSACTGASGTEYMFLSAVKSDVASSAFYRSFWLSSDKSSGGTTFTFNERLNGDTGATGSFRTTSAVVFKDQLFTHLTGELGAGGRGGRVCINPAGCADTSNSSYLSYFSLPRISNMRRIGASNNNSLRNGSYQGGGAPYADASLGNQVFNGVTVQFEHDNDGAAANESQLYLANGGYSNSTLGSARTGNSDGGIMRTILAYSTKTSLPQDCPVDSSGCTTYYEDVTPDSLTKWNSYYSIPWPQNSAVTGAGNCSTSFVEMDCSLPYNTLLPSMKAIPYMRTAPNGDLYLIRNACSTNGYAINGGSPDFRTLRQVCPSGNEVTQLWLMPKNCGTAAACASAWLLVAENATSGQSNMAGNTATCGTSPNKCLTNTHITLLEVVGNYLYIGFDNKDYGANVWRIDMTSVTSGTVPAQSAFSLVNNFGFDGNSANQRIFSHTTIKDSGNDFLLLVTGDGTNPIKVYRTSNN